MKDKLDGIGWFTYHIVKRWVEENPEIQFYFIFDRAFDSSFIFGKNVTPLVVYPPARHPILWYLWYEWAVPRVLDKIQADVFVSLDTYTSTRWAGKKVTAIHDIAFALFDGQVDRITQKFLRFFTPKYIKLSDLIVTVSHSTKNDLIQHYLCPESKIVVAHNAPSHDYKPLSSEEIRDFKLANTSGKDYFIFVGSIHPRKNIIALLRAFELFKKNAYSSHKLVLIGRIWKNEDVTNFLSQMDSRADVIQIPHSPPKIIAKWVGAAISLVMVSIYEGFGVPIVEALASGTPVICSNVSSMPEVAGGGALLVDPNNVTEISNALHTIVSDDSLRKELILSGRKHIEKYKWQSSSEIIWEKISAL
jgi:glycosyltransferase involved in cell wall biosynthesis